jgi:hypothetical protein
MGRCVAEFHTADFSVEIHIPAHHFQMPVIQLSLQNKTQRQWAEIQVTSGEGVIRRGVWSQLQILPHLRTVQLRN